MEISAGIRSSQPGFLVSSPFPGANCWIQPKYGIRTANVREFRRGMKIFYRNGSISLNQEQMRKLEKVISQDDGVSPVFENYEEDVFPVSPKIRSTLDRSFCYDKPIPEEVIGEPVGITLAEKEIGNYPRCFTCEAKGVVLCRTCSGSGLYIDSILESQGILVKVRCLGCGGTGNIMCSECGGRGHI